MNQFTDKYNGNIECANSNINVMSNDYDIDLFRLGKTDNYVLYNYVLLIYIYIYIYVYH